MAYKFVSESDSVYSDLFFLHSAKPQPSSNGKGKKKMILLHKFSDNLMNVAKPFKKPEDERKNEYGFESRKIATKVEDKTTTRNRFVADTESMTNRASR